MVETSHIMQFKEWLAEIDKLASKAGAFDDPTKSYVGQTGDECWRTMWEDGMSPSEAWAEEEDAARSMM